jgi:protein SCO1/2
MSKKAIAYTVFFVVLFIAFYVTLTAMIPGFGEKRIDPISYVRPFSFINQDGKPVTDKDIIGKVYVAEFFFTTCKGICPKMNSNLRQVYEAYKNEKDFLIVSHTCDPETDSAAQLKKYSDSMEVDTNKWMFLTGRKDSLYTMARVSYTIDDPANNLKNIDDDFLHTQFWALVNKKGDVLKIYDGLKKAEVSELIRDIKAQLKKS